MMTIIASLWVAILQQAAIPTEACSAPSDLAGFTGEQSFTQTRTFDGFDQAMVSTGTVAIDGETIVWSVLEPISIVTKITDTVMTQSIDGGPDEPIGAAGAANLPLTSSGLTEILTGDLGAASAYYTIEDAEETAEGWTAKLTPNAETLAELISEVTIAGCNQLRVIDLSMSNGDTISISFSSD